MHAPIKSPIFYGRRLGRRLRANKQDALTAGLAQYGIDKNAVTAVADGSLLPDGFFMPPIILKSPPPSGGGWEGAKTQAPPAKRWLPIVLPSPKGEGGHPHHPPPSTLHCLEIGFGGGEHPHGLATQNPAWRIIGAEAFTNGVANLCEKLAAEPLSNIKIFADDVRFLLPKLADGCLDRVYLLYPDPWPKSRHAKRRFFGPDNIPTIARLLKPGGQWIIASDHPVYQQWVTEQFRLQNYFDSDMTVMGDEPPPGWIQTRYEQKAIAAGRVGKYAILRRKQAIKLQLTTYL
jgi:tRNA (guanine-N7-)-methyltransferase